MKEYERVIDNLGSFGAYQRRAFLLVSLLETPVCWAMLTPMLLNYKPDWFCPNWDEFNDLAGSGDSNWSRIDSYDKYDHYLRTHNGSGVNLTYTKNSCPASGVCPGIKFDTDMVTVVTQWLLICDKEFIAETITSVQMAGVVFGATLTGQVADLFGRKKVLYIEYALLVLTCFICAFSVSWVMYAVVRFFIGGLVGGIIVVAFVLPIELVTPKWRTVCGCIGLWGVGMMIMALLGYFLRDWHHLVMVTSGFSIIMLFSWWFVPESPRWLMSRGKFEEAEEIITKMAEYNNKPLPDFCKLRQATEHLSESGLCCKGLTVIETIIVSCERGKNLVTITISSPGKEFLSEEKVESQQMRKYSYWHLCSSWKLTKNVLILMYGWFVASMVYYGISFNTRNLAGNIYVNICISGAVEIPALLFVVFIHNKLGRRLTNSMLMGLAGVCCFSFLILDLTNKMKELATLTRVLAMIGKAGIAGGWGALMVFSAELFPTVVRNLGVSACAFCARIGGIVAPQLVYLGSSEATVPLPFTIFGVIALILVVLIWALPETKSSPLPDSLLNKRDSSSSCEVVKLNGTLAPEESYPLQA